MPGCLYAGVMAVTYGPMMTPPGAAPPGPPPVGWPTPVPPAPTAPRRRGWIAALSVAIVLSCAALGVGLTALLRPTTAPALPAEKPSPTSRSANTAEVNRAYCNDIAPLMAESDKTAQAFSRLDRKAPDWKAGAQTFMDATNPWLDRMQPVIDSHGDADPYLQRSMQRFVDDTRYLLADLAAGDGPEWLPYDQTIWNDGLGALSGVAHVCYTLGVKW